MTGPARVLLRLHPEPSQVPVPPLDPPGGHRFDDPKGAFAVRYCGTTLRACLLETMEWARAEPATDALLVHVGADDLEWAAAEEMGDWLDRLKVAWFAVPPTDRVVDVNDPEMLATLDEHPAVRQAIKDSGLWGPGHPAHLDEAVIRHAGALGRTITQAVARAVWEWHANAQAIAYRSRHDDEERCFALFDDRGSWEVLATEDLSPDIADHREAVRAVAALFRIELPERWQ